MSGHTVVFYGRIRKNSKWGQSAAFSCEEIRDRERFVKFLGREIQPIYHIRNGPMRKTNRPVLERMAIKLTRVSIFKLTVDKSEEIWKRFNGRI
ncbi:unnamed protein product [Clavelina lepadiformis]|uniref:LAGLIDADG homing endonuclease n=1 Tax=Clavelina lepadiformis TaxID=159417 RepID=A0ABP0F4J1_CLALP